MLDIDGLSRCGSFFIVSTSNYGGSGVYSYSSVISGHLNEIGGVYGNEEHMQQIWANSLIVSAPVEKSCPMKT